MISSQRWRYSLPFIFALGILSFLLWGLYLSILYPFDSIVIATPDGEVRELYEKSGRENSLLLGDVIKSVDGRPFTESYPYYQDKYAGDTVTMFIERDEKPLSIDVELVAPGIEEILSRVMPLFIALIFWGVGGGVQAFRPGNEATGLFFSFFQISALFLISGTLSTIGPSWIAVLYNVLIWLIGPLTVHFHLYFPQNAQIRYRRVLLTGLYLVGALGALPYLIFGLTVTRTSNWLDLLSFGSYTFLIFNFAVVIVLLVHAYYTAVTPGVRGKIRLVVLGGILSFIPLLTLAIVPFAIGTDLLVPYYFSFPFLGLLPLTYGYAIVRHRLIEVERHINRGATYILVFSTLGGLYLLLFVLVKKIFDTDFVTSPFINTLLVLLFAGVIVPFHRQVQHFVDTIFYGGWYDYRSAVTNITQGMEQITDLQTLADVTCSRLVKTFRLEEAVVFLSDLNGDYSIISVTPRSFPAGHRRSYSPLPRSSLSYLLRVGGVVERNALQTALSEIVITPEEHRLLNSEQMHLWVPVIGHGQVLGLMALGPKFGGDIFSGEDLDILRVVARQIGPVIETIHLVTRLRRHAEQLEIRVAERTQELYAEKERVEAILASVGEGVVVTGLDGKIAVVNRAYEQQTWVNAQDITGQPIWKYYSFSEEEVDIEEIENALLDGDAWKGELIGLRKDGSRFDVHLTMTPLRNESAEIVGFVGSQRDITQRKELDRLKDLFVSDVSHELRTPTTNIGLYLDLLQNAPKEKHDAYLRVLKDQTNLLIKLVEDILDLSRLAIGKVKPIEFTRVDLKVLAEQVVTAHHPKAAASGIELILDTTPAPEVWGDANQIARVINNLVGNAIQYTPQGRVEVRIREVADGVILEVWDTGMGIDGEDLPHIFDRFYRGQQVRQSGIHGTGLGLAIVKEIVDRHNSEISIESEVGKGSLVRVRFPVYESVPWLEKQS